MYLVVNFYIFFRLNMDEESPLKSCNALSQEQIRVNHTTCEAQKLLHQSFMHGEHDSLKEHLENNPEHQNFYRSLEQGIELVTSGRRTMSEVAPTLIILLQNGAKWAYDHLLLPGMKTPYHVICRSTGDHQELLELMIKELWLTSVNVKDDNECTALIYAVRNANIRCVKWLITNEADVNVINGKRNVADMLTGVALIDAIQLMHANSPHSYKTMMGIFDLLLDSGADVNQPCIYQNRTPIMYAAALGNVICVKKLIQEGAEVDYTDKTGQTSWTLAARAGSVDVLKCLLEDNGIDKNSIDAAGLSILYWAVGSGNIEAVRYLLKQGVTMTSLAPQAPQDCVEACADCGTNPSCHHLDATQRKTNPYVLAIRCNMSDVVRLMDEYGCEMGKSPGILSHAIRNDSVDVVEYLLCNYKYPFNCGYKDKYDELNFNHQAFLTDAYVTYYQTYSETASVGAIKLLLEHGTGIYTTCSAEKCPGIINAAMYEDNVEVLACFIRGGVTMNTKAYYPDESSTSGLADIGVVLPFEAAVWDDHIYVVEMFLVSGCSRGIHSWNNNHTLKANIITELPLPPQIIKYLSIPELDDIVEKHLYANH